MQNLYDAITIKKRIIEIFENRGIKPYKILPKIGLSKNTLDSANVSMPKADTLAIIADYLDTSTDYLLGRTDEPSMTVSVNNTNATITAPQTNGNENIIIAESPPISEDVRELINIVLTLTPIDRAKALLYVDSLRQEEAKRKPTTDNSTG